MSTCNGSCPMPSNMSLANFLELMNSDLKNEWTHLAFYLYHSAFVCGLHAEEYAEFFTEAAKGEMQHVRQFMDRLIGLEYKQPTTEAHSFPSFENVSEALMYALAIERDVVKIYAKRIAQAETLEDPVGKYLAVFYEDQLQDSYEDAEHIQRLLRTI